MHLYHSRWHELTPDHINALFKAHLNSVSAFPYNLLPKLKRLQFATLEVVEIREQSTVYLIRETGEKYQIYSIKDVLFGDDPVLTSYKIKTPPFIIYEAGNFCFIERLKDPKFKAQYDPVTKEISHIEWSGEKPIERTVISTLKKAKNFLLDRVK